MKFKTAVLRLTLSLLFLLILCTIASVYIQEWMLPQVRTVQVTEKLPLSCIVESENGTTIICVVEREGVWGMETCAAEIRIAISGYSHGCAILEEPLMSNHQTVVQYPSRPLVNGEIVEVVGQ